MTSLLREDVSEPIPSARSRTITSCPANARARAAARPITPAPTTTASTSSNASPRSSSAWVPSWPDRPRWQGRLSPRSRDDTRPGRYHIAAMTTFLTLILVLAMLGVLGVLGMGVATMIRGGNPRLSNRFMQARVVMQGVALLMLVLLMLLAGHR